jgi:hypothetical protein
MVVHHNEQQQEKKIKAPTTTDDDGNPSDSCVDDMERVFRLIEDERHLAAHSLYHNVLSRLEEQGDDDVENKRPSPRSRIANSLRRSSKQQQEQQRRQSKIKDKDDSDKAREVIQQNTETLSKLEVRICISNKIVSNLFLLLLP